MSRRDEEDYEEYDDEDAVAEYKEWQHRSESLLEERRQNYEYDDDHPDKWDAAEERENAGNLLSAVENERYYREEARNDYGDEADEGHDDRIEKVWGMEQVLRNHIAHADGEYEYARPMQDMDEKEKEELEAENDSRWETNENQDDDNSDMDISDDE